MRYTTLTLASLLTTIHALQITSPALGASVDPSKPITVTWVTSPADPATFNLVFLSGDTSFAYGTGDTTVATNIQTSAGSYTIPANKVAGFGSGFSLAARSAAGDDIGSSGTFLLAYSSDRVVTGSNGQFSLAPSSATGGASASTSLSSLTFDTSGVTGSMTATYFPGTSVTPTVGTGPAASLSSFTYTDVTGSMTIQPTASSSSSSNRLSSASSSASRSSASAASTANSQPRIGVGKEVVGVAGLLAGLAAVIA